MNFMSPKITIYTSPSCSHCQALIKWLQEKSLSFTEKDVIENESNRDFIVQKTNQMEIPVTIINDQSGKNEQVVIGFDPDKILKIISNL